MREDKKTAPGVTSTESGKKERAAGAANSIFDFTTGAEVVSSILLTGSGNALPGREICRILGLKNAREVSARVEAERRRGVPICASCDNRSPGYYLPETEAELKDYCRSLRGRIVEINRTLEALEDTLTGQERIVLPKG